MREERVASRTASVSADAGQLWNFALPPDCNGDEPRDVWERRCQALAAVVPDLILRMRRDGTYLDYRGSPEFPSVSSSERVIGRTVHEILPAEVARRRMAAIERALVTGGVEEFTYELAMPHARRLRQERVAACGADEVIVLVRDVTESRKIEQTVRELQGELESLFENVPDVVATLAPNGTLLFVNRCAPGVNRDAVVGTTIYQQLAPQEHAAVRAAIRHVVATGQSSSFLSTTLGRLGPRGSYACRLGAVTRDGSVVGLTLVASDVTERERMLDAVRESEERYRGLVEGSHDAIFITMRDGRVVDFNQAALNLFGYARDELPNVSALYVDPADRDRFRAEIERHGSVRDYAVKLRRRDGTKFVGLLTATLRTAKDGTIVGYEGILRDVTERRRLEREVLASSERERRRIGQDLHDGLGQHLMGVAFLSKVLSDQLAAKGLGEAGDAARIQSLISEAISQTRRLARGLQPVALDNGGLAAALEEMASHVTEFFGIPCTCRILEEPVLSDNAVATHVYYITREAIHNAVKHGQARGVWVELSSAGDHGVLSVQDDGIGFPQGAKTRGGLGLNIMRYRAEMIGGSVDVKATPGAGTLVVCRFPVPGAAAKEGNGGRERAVQAYPAG